MIELCLVCKKPINSENPPLVKAGGCICGMCFCSEDCGKTSDANKKSGSMVQKDLTHAEKRAEKRATKRVARRALSMS